MSRAFVALCLLVLVLPSAGAPGDDRPQFGLRMVSKVDDGAEPTLSYAPNGTVWIAGMNVSGAEGNLWYANNDTSTFNHFPDPPTTGGTDATVHHDADGRLFWAELNGDALRVGVYDANGWQQRNFSKGDRPWFRTNSSGATFLAFANLTNPAGSHVELWKNTTGTPGWTAVNDSSNPVNTSSTLADFQLHDDALYLLLRDNNNEKIYVAHRAASSSVWSFTKNFSAAQHGLFGIPRLAIDATGNVYVSFGESTVQENSVWFRRYVSSTTEWTEAALVGTSGNTTAFAGLVAGAQGKLGFVSYTTPDGSLPNATSDDAVWTVEYAMVTGAHTSSPTISHRVTVVNEAHVGKLDKGTPSDWLGDFTSIALRQGDSAGKVVMAYACDAADAQLRCVPQPGGSPRLPAFAVQISGQGLL